MTYDVLAYKVYSYLVTVTASPSFWLHHMIKMGDPTPIVSAAVKIHFGIKSSPQLQAAAIPGPFTTFRYS
jgi:hypothetical protein